MTDNITGFVTLHFGPMSPKAMRKASDLAGEDAVLDTDIARMAGASFALGPQGALDALKERLAPAAVQEMRNTYADLSPAAVNWLATGQRGLSSEAIFSHLTGIKLRKWDDEIEAHPNDPGDLRRCRLLLEEVPELKYSFEKMKELSPTWARLVSAWDEICAQMDEEAPEWTGPTPKTKHLMEKILARQ